MPRTIFFKLEKIIYFITWSSAVLYAIFCFARSSFKYFKNHKDYFQDFSTGWYFLSTKRDSADFEWESIFYLLSNFYPWIFFYLFVSEVILRNINATVRVLQLWQTIFTLLFIEFKFGGIILCIVLCQPIIFYCTNTIYKNSKLLTWGCTGITLALITYCKSVSVTEHFQEYVSVINGEGLYIVTLSLFWLNLKCSSYYLIDHNTHFLDFFSYCLYPPTFFTGPFISYKEFQNLYKFDDFAPAGTRLKKFIVNFTSSLFWFLFGNFWLHYIYVNATSFQPKLVETFNNWSLYGFGYAMGQFFHIKYVILYGLSTSCARFENVCVPSLPRCIGRIYLYSDMWKYFDPGLYTFLLRHIYIPVTRSSVNSKLIGSFLCFLFVYLWHGVEQYILIWTLLNYLGVTLEYLCNMLYKSVFEGNNYLTLTSHWFRRLKCFLAASLLAVSAVSNFYFFAGTEIGNIFVKRILTEETLIHNLFLIIILYCCCQVSTELQTVGARKM